MRFSSPRHLLVGVTFDSWCGIYGVVNRGLAATRDETKMSCGNCRRSLNAHRKQETAKDRQGLGEPPKNVTPRS